MRTLADAVRAEAWAEPAPWKVVSAWREIHDVVTLELEPPAGQSFSFEPGQFDMLSVPGMGEVPISISSDPAEPATILHSIRDVGAVTHALSSVGTGDVVGLRGPFGTHWPVHEAEGGDLVIVAGGIGLPPLRPAIYRALANRDRYRRVVILYGARTPGDLLFTEELAEWRRRFDLEIEVTVDAAQGGWHGDVGVVPDFIGRARFDPAATTAFTVGPEIMMRFAVRGFRNAGVPDGRIFLSMERNMQCAVGLCGHCQVGPFFVCRDGAVFSYERIAPWFETREL